MKGIESTKVRLASMFVFISCSLAPQLQASGESRYETGVIEGVGVSKRDAIHHALNIGLSQIMDHEYPEHASKSKKYTWSRRIIMALPHMVIKDNYDLLAEWSPSRNRGKTGWRVNVKVRLPQAELAAAWTEAQNLLSWVGNPTVALFSMDRIEDHRQIGSYEDDDSIAGQQFAEAMQEHGIHVKIAKHVTELKENHQAFGKRDHLTEDALEEIRRRHKADLYFECKARAVGPTAHHRTPGRTEYDWETYAKAHVYWTDDATQMATLDLQGLGSDNDSDAGRITGLRNVGTLLADAFMEKMFEEWSRWAFEGRPVTFTISGCGFREAQQLRQALSADHDKLDIQSIGGGNDLFEIKFLTKLPAFDVAVLISELSFVEFNLVDIDVRARTVRAVVRYE